MSIKGYAFTSSGEQVTAVVAIVLFYRHHTCGAPWCLRLGKHPTADGLHKLCRKHHPDLPNHKLTLAEIHLRHHAAMRRSSESAETDG